MTNQSILLVDNHLWNIAARKYLACLAMPRASLVHSNFLPSMLASFTRGHEFFSGIFFTCSSCLPLCACWRFVLIVTMASHLFCHPLCPSILFWHFFLFNFKGSPPPSLGFLFFLSCFLAVTCFPGRGHISHTGWVKFPLECEELASPVCFVSHFGTHPQQNRAEREAGKQQEKGLPSLLFFCLISTCIQAHTAAESQWLPVGISRLECCEFAECGFSETLSNGGGGGWIKPNPQHRLSIKPRECAASQSDAAKCYNWFSWLDLSTVLLPAGSDYLYRVVKHMHSLGEHSHI